MIYVFAFLCNDVSGCPAPSVLRPFTLSIDRLKAEIQWPEEGIVAFYDGKVTLCVLGYYLLSLFLQVFLPGQEIEGVRLACGGRLTYKFNGILCFIGFPLSLLRNTDFFFFFFFHFNEAFLSATLTLAGCAVGTYLYGADFVVWTFLWDNYIQVITANLLICTVISIFVYVGSFSVPSPGMRNPDLRELAPGGHTGNVLYDFFIGRELNPRIQLPIPFASETSSTIDLKLWCEMRPGLLGWLILNLSNVARQYRTYGHVTDSIILITLFQSFYVLDALYMESSILTMIDTIMDGFGFMLSFGDLVWVPFLYSVQTRYLAVFPLELGITGVCVVLGVTTAGYLVFRGANNQKNRFRTNPNDPRVKNVKYIQTRTGSRLMVSGWWGYARHINYLGDWIMSWGYCLPTGIAGYTIIETLNPTTGGFQKQAVQTPEVRGWGTLFTYFYVLYFGVLLVHREQRDEEKCKKKYGVDWERYTSLVRSRILPGVY